MAKESSHPFSPLRTTAGGLALALSAITLAYFGWQHSQQFAEQAHDCRALTEGLRVQFYWNLAGLGKSVSGNYMHRQRSELDWIRAAIRGVCLPYEQWRDNFARLSNTLKVKTLRAVKCSWIDHQFDYFDNRFKEHHLTLHAWHRLGKVLALAGVLSGLVWWSSDWSLTIHHLLDLCLLRGLLLGVVFVLGACAWPYLCSSPGESKRRHLPAEPESWKLFVHNAVPKLSADLFPTNTSLQRFGRLVLNFLGYLPAALWLTALVVVGCLFADQWYPSGPPAHDWGIILAGALLVSGALAVAWAEKNLFSEFAYQYQTMSALFQHASRRLDRSLQELELLPDGSREFESQLSEIQGFLFALGQEALDENAEWLILHRARPLEPVMAG